MQMERPWTDRFDWWNDSFSTNACRCRRVGNCSWDCSLRMPRDWNGSLLHVSWRRCSSLQRRLVRDCAFPTLTEQTILTPRLAEKTLIIRGYGRDCSNIVPNILTISILRSRNKSVANTHADRFSLNAKKWSISVLARWSVAYLGKGRDNSSGCLSISRTVTIC